MRKISGSINKSKCLAIFINQIREKVGVMFGNPETTPGGRALKFYSSVRLEVRRAQAIKDGNDTVGNQTRIKVVKNKVAPPFKQAEVDIMYGEGISYEGTLIDLGSDDKEYTNEDGSPIVLKSGAWYSYGEDKIGQGRENAKKFLKENPDIAKEIDTKIRKAHARKTGMTLPEEAPQEPSGSTQSDSVVLEKPKRGRKPKNKN